MLDWLRTENGKEFQTEGTKKLKERLPTVFNARLGSAETGTDDRCKVHPTGMKAECPQNDDKPKSPVWTAIETSQAASGDLSGQGLCDHACVFSLQVVLHYFEPSATERSAPPADLQERNYNNRVGWSLGHFTSLAAVSWERYCLMDAIRLSSKKEARHTLLICSCMVRDWSIFTPRYLTQAWKTTSVPLKQADCRSMDEIRERAPTSIISVLSVLSLSLMQFVQKRTSLTQFWTSVRVREKSTGEQLFESSVSSAYLWKTQPWLEITSERGCEYKVNRTGPSTEPCGTPHANGEGEDISPSTMTDWERPVR